MAEYILTTWDGDLYFSEESDAEKEMMRIREEVHRIKCIKPKPDEVRTCPCLKFTPHRHDDSPKVCKIYSYDEIDEHSLEDCPYEEDCAYVSKIEVL